MLLLSKAERNEFLGELLKRTPHEARVAHISHTLEKLPTWWRAKAYDGVMDEVLNYTRSDVTRRAMIHGFGRMLTEEQEDVLAAMMGCVPSHRRADAVIALLDGTSGEDEAGAALATGLMHAGPRGRNRCFTRLSQQEGLLSSTERARLAGILSYNDPSTRNGGCQTDLSWADVDETFKSALDAAIEKTGFDI